jgi:hypothetical protein
VTLYDTQGRERLCLFLPADEPGLLLEDQRGNHRAEFAALEDGPVLRLEDADGNAAILGATQLEAPGTATTAKRRAASLVMLDKEKKVIWKAP